MPLRNLPLPSKALQDAAFTSLQERMSKDLFAFDAETRKENDALSLERIGGLQLPEEPSITGSTGYESMLGDADLGETQQNLTEPNTDVAETQQNLTKPNTALMSPTLDMPAMSQPRRQAVYDPTQTIDIQGEPDYDPSADTGTVASGPTAAQSAPATAGGTPQPMPQISQPNETFGPIEEGKPDRYFATAGPYARQVERETGIPAQLSLAISANETGYGQRRYMAGSNNYHGIQDTTGTGTPYKDWRPGPNGEKIYYEARQAGFETPLEGFRGFANFLLNNPRYKPALDRYQQTKDVNQLAADIHQAGYAEDPAYTTKITSIMRGIPVSTGVGDVTAPAGTGAPATSPTQRAAEGRAASGEFNPQAITQTYAGKPYVFGGAGGRSDFTPGVATDCSGFVAAVWKNQYGIDLAAHTDTSYNQLRNLGAPEVSQQDARAGDIVYYMGAGTGGAITHHMGIYAGNGKVLDMSVSGGSGVRERDIGHAGRFVILRDPRINPTEPKTAQTPPPIVPSADSGGVALKTRADADVLALTADLPSADSPLGTPAGGPTPAGVSPLDEARATTGGGAIMARQPLDAGVPVRDRWTDEPVVPYDPDSGPREATPGSAGAAPIISPMAPPENPGASVTAAQPAPPQIQISQGGPPTPAAQWTPVETAPPRQAAPVVQEPQIQQQGMPTPGLKPVWDAAGQIIGYVQGAASAVQDAYAVPTEQRPPQYSGPSYAQPQVPEGQRPYFAPTETEVGAVRAGIEATQAAEPAGTSWLPEPLQRPAGAALGALQTVQAASDAVKARIDPRVWGFARDGIAREILTPEELARWTQLGSATYPDGTPKSYADYRREQSESQAFADRIEARYQQIKDDPDALTRYANASPAYAATAAVTDLAVAPAVGALASGAVRAGATAAGAGARTARAAGYAADVAGQSIVDPTSLPLQPAADAIIHGIGAATRATGRAARGLAEEGARRLAPGVEQAADDGTQMLGSGVVPSRRMYHGTAGAFARPDPGKFDPDGLFGPGYYLTSDPRVAGGYAESRGIPQTVTAEQVRAHLLNIATQTRKTGAKDADRLASSFERAAEGVPDGKTFGRMEAGRISASAAWDNSLADIDMTDSRLWGPARAERDSLFQERGANIRAVDVPSGLRMLDMESPVGADGLRAISEAAPDSSVGQMVPRWIQSGAAEHMTGNQVYENLFREFNTNGQYPTPAEAKRAVNDVMRAAGYDGISHQGGKRVPMLDDAGNPIEHDVTIVFPESLTKITNAFSGEPGGAGVVYSRLPGLQGDALNAAGGGVFGAASEDMQAQQEGRAPDPAERARRALIGAGLATAGGRYARRGPAAERARAAGTQHLGSGVVGNESMNAVTRTHVIPPHVADELDFPVRNPTDPAVLRAIEAAGGTVDERGTTLNVIRNQHPEASGGAAVRGMPFYIAGPKGTPNPYAGQGGGTGGPLRIEGQTRFRSPLILSDAPGDGRGFDEAMQQLGQGDHPDVVQARRVADETSAAGDAAYAQRDDMMQRWYDQHPGWTTDEADVFRASPEYARLTDELFRTSDANLKAREALRAAEEAHPAATAETVERGLREAQKAGPEGSPARIQAVKDLVARYGGEPDLIEDLMTARYQDVSERTWAIKENIVAANARKQQYDGVVTVQPRSPAPDEIAKHPAVKAVEAERFEINRRLGQIPREVDARGATLGLNAADTEQSQDPVIVGLIDEYNRLGNRRFEIPQALEDAKTQAYRELTEGRITELADPREARNPTPGSPNADMKAAYKRAKDAEARFNDLYRGPPKDEETFAAARREVEEANAALDALMNEADVPTGYELRPDIPRRGDVRASTIEENPRIAAAERAIQEAHARGAPSQEFDALWEELWKARAEGEFTTARAALPFDPASAAAGGAAGAASEDEEGQQGDPLRTGAGMLMAGVLGRRFPDARAWYRRAAVKNAAEMATKGISPASKGELVRGTIATAGQSSLLGPATAAFNAASSLMQPIWAIPKEPTRAVMRAIGTRNPEALKEPLVAMDGVMQGMGHVGEALWDVLRARGKYAPNVDAPNLSQRISDPIGRGLMQALEAPGRVWAGAPDAVFGTLSQYAVDARRAAQLATDAGHRGQKWEDWVDLYRQEAERVRSTGSKQVSADVTDIIKTGDTAAERAAYRQPLGEIGKQARNIARLGNNGPVGQFVAPFFNSPWNIHLQAAERSPAGFLMNTQASKFDKHYDAVVGSAAILGMVEMARRGNLTVNGSGPTNQNERQAWLDEGNRPYSTVIAGVAIPNRAFTGAEPLMNAVGETFDFMRYQKSGADNRALTNEGITRVGRLIKQYPYAAGYATLADLAEFGVPAAAADVMTRFTPGAATLRGIGTAGDTAERTVDRGKGVPMVDEAIQRWQQATGQRADLPVAQNILGEPKANPQPSVWAFFGRLGYPKEDPVISIFQDAQMLPSDPRDQITLDAEDGVKITLKPGERRQWDAARGEVLRKAGAKLAANPSWVAMPLEGRQETLQELMDDAAEAADEHMKQVIGGREINRRVRAEPPAPAGRR